MAGCYCLHMFCLGILQRSACFFYDIRGGFFSPLSSVLLILPCGMFPEAFTFGAGVISQSFIGPIACFGFVLWPFARRRGLRARLSLVYELFAFNYSVLVVLLAVLQFVSFPVALLTSDSIFRLGHGATLAISSAYHRYPSSIGIGLCVAVLRLYPFYSQSVAWRLVLPSALFQGCMPILPL